MTDKATESTKARNARDEADEAAAKTAEVQATRAEIDAQFRADIAKATEKRDKALAKLPDTPGANIEEVAWNDTKRDDDPPYNALAIEHRQKLHTAAEAVRATGSAGIVGLEAYEARVKELLEAEKVLVGAEGSATIAAKSTIEKAGK